MKSLGSPNPRKSYPILSQIIGPSRLALSTLPGSGSSGAEAEVFHNVHHLTFHWRCQGLNQVPCAYGQGCPVPPGNGQGMGSGLTRSRESHLIFQQCAQMASSVNDLEVMSGCRANTLVLGGGGTL